jgi:cytoskeletal protein CcmA (bactofilin family)
MLVSSLAAPNLGAAGSFAVLAASTVTNTGASAISGDLGLSPGTSVTGFPPGMLAGTQYVADPASAQAQLDLTAAYNDAAARTVGAITLAGNLGGMTLAPGLYKSTSSLEISSGDLTLDAKGDASAVYIFQMGSTLVTTVGRKVILAGGAQAANIYWQVGSSATLGVSSVFKGTIMAMASITATTGASVEGRLLARTAAVTLDDNSILRTAAVVAVVPAPAPAPGVCQDVTTLVAGGSSGSICSSAAFTSGANSTVNGWVTAKAATTLGATSRVHGDVTAGAAYTSGDGSVVEGNVSASGDVTLGANSRILGTVHSGTGVITYGAGATVGGVIRAASISGAGK